MECPVCYSEYDRETHKPKITQCGHSICEDCIKHMSKCCICKQEFQPVRDNTPGYHSYGGHRMAVFEDSLDRYMQINSIRSRYDTWNRPAAPLVPTPVYSTNFALLDLIDKKQPKQFTTCMKTKEYEDFYCLDCNSFTCNSCIDEDHINHSLKKIAHDVVVTVHSLDGIAGVVYKEIVDAVMMDDSLTALKQKNTEVALALPDKVNSFFDELIAEIQETRKKVLESVANSTVEKEGKVQTLIQQNEVLKTQFSNVGQGVQDLLQQIKDSKYVYQQELKPKSEQLAELHKQAQSSLTYLKAQSETDDLKVADFSHAKNTCFPRIRDALESTLRLSTLVEPSLEVSRAMPSERLNQDRDNEDIPLDDLNETRSRRSNSLAAQRSRSAGSRFARALSGLNLGLGNPYVEQSRSSRSRPQSRTRTTNSRRLEISTSDRSGISGGSRDHMRVFFQGYPWIDNARDELLDQNRGSRRRIETEYPQRNNYIGRNQNFSALEVIERITQAHNRAPPTRSTGNSSARSVVNNPRNGSHDSDGVEHIGRIHTGVTQSRSSGSNNTRGSVNSRSESSRPRRNRRRSRTELRRSSRSRDRRSSHNSELNREVLHRAISDLNRLEQAQRRSRSPSERSNVSSPSGTGPQQYQPPAPQHPPQSVPTQPRASLNFFSTTPFTIPSRPTTPASFFTQLTPPPQSTGFFSSRAPPF